MSTTVLHPSDVVTASIRHRRRWPWIAGGVFLLALLISGCVIASHWPFTQAKVTAALERQFQGSVEMQGFEKQFFPHPGCILRGVKVYGPVKDPQHPLIAANTAVARGAYSSFITQSKTVEVQATGLHIFIPAEGAPKLRASSPKKGSKPAIESFETDNAVLEIARNDPQEEPLRFEIHHLRATPLTLSHNMQFRVALRNPLPPGEAKVEGQFGPWRPGEAGATPLSGSYTFSNANLGVFSGIDGQVSSTGKFTGQLGKVDVNGTVNSPNFEVRSSGHPIQLAGNFQAYVNGTNGDVRLRETTLTWGRTTLVAHGDIAGKPGEKGKTVIMDMAVQQGRIQDLMRLVAHSDPPAIQGPVQFQGRAILPPGKEKFIKRVQFAANFGIEDAKLTKKRSQAAIGRLSARARGHKVDEDEDPARVLSDLAGNVALRGGVAHFSRASFRVPGAVAGIAGTYNLVNQQIGMYGRLRMSATVSEASSGVKAVFLKMLDPFFKKKSAGAGADVPVRISGTYSRPQFGLNLMHREGP